MTLFRWSCPVLAVGLLLAGCQSQDTLAGTGGAGASGTARPAAPAATPVPEGLALSYLRTVGPQTCEWVRQEVASGERTTVFSFGAPCTQSAVSWSPDGTEGLVFIMPDSQAARPLLWRVDLGARTGKPVALGALPLKPVKGAEPSRLERVGYDAQGRVLALVFLGVRPQRGDGGKYFIPFEGSRYAVGPDVDSAGLAVAYRLEGADWKTVEVRPSSGDEAAEHSGTDVLDSARELPSSWSGLGGPLPGREASKAEARTLDATVPGLSPNGRWRAWPTPGGALFYRAVLDLNDDSLYPATPVRWDQGGKPQPLEGMSVKDESTLSMKLQGDMLLLYLLEPETRSAYLYDTRSKKRLGFADNATNPDFWPRAGTR